jgi:hypothetical protein
MAVICVQLSFFEYTLEALLASGWVSDMDEYCQGKSVYITGEVLNVSTISVP